MNPVFGLHCEYLAVLCSLAESVDKALAALPNLTHNPSSFVVIKVTLESR